MNETNEEASLTLDKKTMDVLVAHIIPTSKYFESRFDHMQSQIDHLSDNLTGFRADVDRRFEQVDQRFEEVNRRFEQVDHRFEEVNRRFEQVDQRFDRVDRRFEQVIASIDRLADKLDYRDEKQRGFTLRMFTIAIGISILGALGAFLKSFGIQPAGTTQEMMLSAPIRAYPEPFSLQGLIEVLRHFPRAVLFLFCLAVPFFFGTARSSGQETGERNLLREALRSIAATPADLGIRPDMSDNPRPARFHRWISAPLDAVEHAQADAGKLFATGLDPLLWLWEIRNLEGAVPPAHHPARPAVRLRPLDNCVNQGVIACLAPLLLAMEAAAEEVKTALCSLNKGGFEGLTRCLLAPKEPVPEHSGEEDGAFFRETELRDHLDSALQVDRDRIWFATLSVAAAAAAVKARLNAFMAAGGTVATRTLELPLGQVRIGGPEADRHDGHARLIVDVGGNDVYLSEDRRTAPGGAPKPGYCRVVLDLAGNDLYRGGDFSQGSGIGGIGILWDAAGDDVYMAGDFSQGAGFFGAGLLVDEAGRDRYSGGAFVQAAAAWGWGGLLDLEGEDSYECRHSGQAFAGVLGVACLCDRTGNDKYFAGAAEPDHRDPGMNLSLAQGFSTGVRGLAGGGYALLADQWGNDHYECQYFGQGAGYWMGVGALLDQAGRDTYTARRYAQGAGIHYALGLLLDAGGADRYLSWGVSQACGHDYGIGVLVDASGNDIYAADRLSMGAANANGTGIFIDNAGDDRYAPHCHTPAGKLTRGRRAGGMGVFVDAGGVDSYTRDGADNTIWGKNRFAAGIDANEGGVSGVPLLLPCGGEPPENPAVTARRQKEQQRLARLVARAERLPAPRNVAPLLEAAAHRGLETDMPRQARETLFSMDPATAVPALVDLLDVADVSALVLLKEYFLRYAFHSRPALMDRAHRGEGPVPQSRSLQYLGALKDTRALPVCLKHLNAPSWKVRSAAVRAAGDLLDHARLQNLLPMEAAFRRAMDPANSNALASYLKGNEKRSGMVLSVLVRALPVSFEDYETFSRGAKKAPAQDPAAQKVLAAFTQANLPHILPAIKTWIRDIEESGRIAPSIAPLLKDSDPAVRRAAAYALGQMQYRPAIPAILDLLNDPHLWVRDAAVLSLALFREDALGPLVKRMPRESPAFRVLALDVLHRMKMDAANQVVAASLTDTNEDVAGAAKRYVEKPHPARRP